MKRAACALAAALLFAAWALAILLPGGGSSAPERYRCEWETGQTYESFSDICAVLTGADEAGARLVRNGESGVVAPTAAYAGVYETLQSGTLPELLSLGTEEISRPERAALWMTFSARLWYADEPFAWTGRTVARAVPDGRFQGGELVVFSGMPSAQLLASLGTRSLIFREPVAWNASALIGTRVERVICAEPYACADDVVTLRRGGSVRIVCALPLAERLVLPDADFADAGALLPCAALREVSVPFAGSARSAGENAAVQFSHLFSDGTREFVPDTLRKVTVRGGTLAAHAFYGCPMIEEIDCCGAEEVSRTAFADCTGLRVLHCPRGDVALAGEFAREALACGCTRFVRMG